MPHFFAAEKVLHAHPLKQATATRSLTRLKGLPKLFACTRSLRTMGFTATSHHQPDQPEQKCSISKRFVPYWQTPRHKIDQFCYLALLNAMGQRKTQWSHQLSQWLTAQTVRAGATSKRLSLVNHHFASETLKCLPRNKSSRIINQRVTSVQGLHFLQRFKCHYLWLEIGHLYSSYSNFSEEA